MNDGPFLSVILCSYNPQRDHLQAALDSLRTQSLRPPAWELILVDNHSSPPIAGRFDVSWHPLARVVVETTQGLAHARRRGYVEARGELIVHSDDDNVFAPDYLEVARRLHREHPHLGTYGGQLIPRFARPPRNDLERRFGEERRLAADVWSNIIDDPRTMPWGAGMCLRREVVSHYLAETERDPRRLILGRTGARLLTGEDLDLNYTAVKHGYGTGLFAALSLEHIIPERHLDPEHHIRYKGEANGYSVTILKFLHLGQLGPAPLPWTARFATWLRRRRMSAFDRRRAAAWDRGVANAIADIRKWGWTGPGGPAATSA